jgi:imidazolonepropionase-like amidohydrolase
MMSPGAVAVLLWSGSVMAQQPPAPHQALRCERLFDARAAQMREGPFWLVIAEGRIAEVRSEAPPDLALVDAPAGSCLPGLIDLHTHITSESGPGRYIERYSLPATTVALRATGYARATLDAGFTTVRDLGDRDGVSVALRDAIAAGWIEGPRIYTSAKSIATTGGHADPSNGQKPGLTPSPGPAEGVINGPEEAYRAVRQRYQDGADLIKITATGGVLSLAKNGLNPQFSQAEANAIVAAANDYGMAVAAHAHGAEGMKRAVLAGVRTIEHGSYMSDEIMRLMIDKGTWYVPTILAGWWTAEKAKEEGYYPPMVAAKASAISPQIATTFGKAWRAGVPIAFGTDSGVSPHGMNSKEFELMVEAGMPAAAALQTATWNAAQVLSAEADLGSLEAGKLADIVLVEGDPSVQIKDIHKVRLVIKEGRVVARPSGREMDPS